MCTTFPDKTKTLKPEFHCPSHCKKVELTDPSMFSIGSEGNLTLKTSWKDEAEIHDYCAAYQCKDPDSGWKVNLEACVCAKHSAIEHLNSIDYSGVSKCCPTLTKNERENLKCGSNVRHTCPHDYYDSVKLNDQINISSTEVNFVKKSGFSGPTSVALINGQNHYCVGFQFSKDQTLDTLFEARLFYCPPSPCIDGKPCIRQCCDDGKMGLTCGGPKVNQTEMKNFDQLKKFANDQDFGNFFFDASKLQKSCPSTHTRMEYLKQDKCKQRFELDMDPISKQVNLKYDHARQTLGPKEFCLHFEENKTAVSAQYCTDKQSENTKFDFYPWILVTSCFFLLLTILVYLTFYKKLMTTYYTKIMINFTAMMFLAFFILAINQFHAFVEDAPGLCVFFGFLQQYSFLTAFALMTVMSLEIMLQIHGSPDNKKRFRNELIFAYSLPLAVTILSLITELAASECSLFKPRFAEETCFFASIEAKALWFYLPIGVFLLANILMFTLTVRRLCNVDAEQRKVNGKRTDNWDKFLIYLRLFLGMGAIWIFEIIAGLFDEHVHESAWYLTDILNMFQGFYVFLIFVCKRNVIFAIFDVKDTKDKTVRATLKQRLLPKRLTDLQERQTEMVSMNSITNSSSSRPKEPNPRALAQNSSAY